MQFVILLILLNVDVVSIRTEVDEGGDREVREHGGVLVDGKSLRTATVIVSKKMMK